MTNQPCCHGLSPPTLKAIEELGDVAPSLWKARRAKRGLLIKECVETFGMAKPTWRHRMGSNSCWSLECRNQTRGCCVPLAPFNSFYIENGLPTVSFKKFSRAIEDWHPITESYFLCHLTLEIVSLPWIFKLSSQLHNSRPNGIYHANHKHADESGATLFITTKGVCGSDG